MEVVGFRVRVPDMLRPHRANLGQLKTMEHFIDIMEVNGDADRDVQALHRLRGEQTTMRTVTMMEEVM